MPLWQVYLNVVKLSYIPHMICQSVLNSIFVLAEPSREEQGVTRYGYSKIWRSECFNIPGRC